MNLFERMIAGDSEAFPELVRAHTTYMKTVCRSVISNRSEADDIVLRVISELPELVKKMKKPQCKAQTFLYQVCYNYCRNFIRARVRYDRVKFEFSEVGAPFVESHITSLDLELVLNRERVLLGALPKDYAQIYELKKIGNTHAEISKVLNIKQGTCRRRYFDIKRVLRNDKMLQRLRDEIL